jgi:site-specific DNA-methyltransferase (adenine-specific)
MNTLYFADCLDVLKDLHHHHPEGFIDLVYIDPPFNSKRDYNILFESIDVKDSKAQREAFADTWSNVSYIDSLNEIQNLDLDLYNFLKALDNIRISKSAVSYLTTMAIRIFYIHKTLKDTGSFYLHCDPTMSHYLKLVCDLIFGEKNFRNEISWKRSQPKSHTSLNFSNCRDIILRYTMSDKFTFNKVYGDRNETYLENFYKYHDKDGRRYRLDNLANPNKNRPNLTYEFLGVTRVWRWTKERMQKAYEEGKVIQTKPGTVPQFKRYLDDSLGQPISDNWDDIEHLHGAHSEMLGYPTQKPEELLERIIKVSSNENELVADFFCGCGTSIAVSQKLKRNWLGVDISHLAIKLIVDRLTDPYPTKRAKIIRDNIQILGFPRDVDSAKMLARESDNGRFGFQDWIVEVMLGGVSNPKKVADGGFDGYVTFYKTEKEKGLSVIEVKSGNVTIKNIREFIQVVKTQKAEHGVFVCFNEQVTKPMLLAAKEEGYFYPELWQNRFDKIQILTVEDILDGKGINLPLEAHRTTTFKKATKSLTPDGEQVEIF